MSRAATIAATAAATGALIAVSVISVVAISSSASSQGLPDAKTSGPVAAAVSDPSAGESSPVTADDLRLANSVEDLIVPTVPTALPAASRTGSNQTIAARSTAKTTGSDVGGARAKAAVLKVAPGRVEGVSATKRGGYSAYAVKVVRADGSVVIGYVDRATGVVFDWATVSRSIGSASTSANNGGRPTDSQDDSDSEDADDDSRESTSDEDGQYEDSHDDDNGEYESDDHESEGSDD